MNSRTKLEPMLVQQSMTQVLDVVGGPFASTERLNSNNRYFPNSPIQIYNKLKEKGKKKIFWWQESHNNMQLSGAILVVE